MLLLFCSVMMFIPTDVVLHLLLNLHHSLMMIHYSFLWVRFHLVSCSCLFVMVCVSYGEHSTTLHLALLLSLHSFVDLCILHSTFVDVPFLFILIVVPVIPFDDPYILLTICVFGDTLHSIVLIADDGDLDLFTFIWYHSFSFCLHLRPVHCCWLDRDTFVVVRYILICYLMTIRYLVTFIDAFDTFHSFCCSVHLLFICSVLLIYSIRALFLCSMLICCCHYIIVTPFLTYSSDCWCVSHLWWYSCVNWPCWWYCQWQIWSVIDVVIHFIRYCCDIRWPDLSD